MCVCVLVFSFIQSLRAFRRAEIVFDAVLFASCAVGAAVAMTVASIFRFEFWFLWCVVLGVFFVPFGRLCGSQGFLWSVFEVIWRCFGLLFGVLGRPLGCFGVPWGPLGVLWVSKGAPGSSLGVSGPISRIFREIPGALFASFWLLFACFLGYFLGCAF